MTWLLAACPYCARTSEEGQTVYYIATGLMLLVPVILVAALAIWIQRRSRGMR